ncbi:MAG: DUF6516 family protein [Desulfococcaceae bacterium]|jgi:hypothetical protein|nr:DUF6516 family protein [Desulfococcaceae bacterium]
MLTDEYFRKAEHDISQCPYVVEFHTSKDKRSLHIGIIEGRIIFIDGSALCFVEFVNVKELVEKYKYSYNYQDKDGKMLFRYDMAPHHRNLKTFPHHKHLESGEIINAFEPDLKSILEEISTYI